MAKESISDTLGLGAIGIFILQVDIMDRWAPGDAQGIYFRAFVLIEVGGGLIVGFYALFRERKGAVNRMSGASKVNDGK
ncbi:MAG: hypothetical protein WBG54_02875 [Acidobacteriaceae bacterium]